MFHLSRCIPSSLMQKKVVLENAGKATRPGSVALGANVTPFASGDDSGAWEPNLFAKAVLAASHTTGVLNNQVTRMWKWRWTARFMTARWDEQEA